MPPMKLGGSKWRPLGATVVFDGTWVVEWTVEDSVVEEIVALDEDVLGTVVDGASVLLVVIFGILLPENKTIQNSYVSCYFF